MFPLDLRLCVITLSDVVPFEVNLWYTYHHRTTRLFIAIYRGFMANDRVITVELLVHAPQWTHHSLAAAIMIVRPPEP